jgi:hypothetical protein
MSGGEWGVQKKFSGGRSQERPLVHGREILSAEADYNKSDAS